MTRLIYIKYKLLKIQIDINRKKTEVLRDKAIHRRHTHITSIYKKGFNFPSNERDVILK